MRHRVIYRQESAVLVHSKGIDGGAVGRSQRRCLPNIRGLVGDVTFVVTGGSPRREVRERVRVLRRGGNRLVGRMRGEIQEERLLYRGSVDEILSNSVEHGRAVVGGCIAIALDDSVVGGEVVVIAPVVVRCEPPIPARWDIGAGV